MLLFQLTAEVEELKAARKEGGLEWCKRLLERKRDEWENVPLNMAVIGTTGAGKSSFINAIRGLTAWAADVGTTETTMEPRSYPHPDNPMLKFWELPGVGTDQFPRATYLTDIDVDRYDFFLLMTADHFTESDTWLGKEIRKRNKKYFFVRTKIGGDILNSIKAHPKTHNEEAVIEEIRCSTEDQLRIYGSEDVPLFLIDNYEHSMFDFETLKQRLIEYFPKKKRTALMFSLRSTSEEMIKLKVAELQSRIMTLAALSSAKGAILIPGVSAAIDLGIIIPEAMFYFKQLGLDSESLHSYANLHSVDCVKLQSVSSDTLGIKLVDIDTVEGMKSILLVLLTRSAPVLAATRDFLPVIECLMVAAPLSFGGTYLALKLILDKFTEAALQVMKFAAGRADESDDVAAGGAEVPPSEDTKGAARYLD